MAPRVRLTISVAVLISVFIAGTAGYAIIEDQPIFDAAYMAIITISTVGFNEHITLSHAGRLWTIFLIFFGVAGVSLAFTSLITLFISGDIKELVGRRKLQTRIDHLKNHTILCGYGRMGALTASDFKQKGVAFVVIEKNNIACEKLKEENIPYVHGDATEDDVLEAAGLHRAKVLVAALAHDADNVYITLTARGENPHITIIARAEQPSTEPKLKRAGADRVICPHIVGAHKISNIVTQPNVVDFYEVAAAGIELELDEFIIAEGSPLCEKSLRNADIRKAGDAMVVAIKHADGNAEYQPGPEQILHAGDILIMIGRTGVSSRLHDLATNQS